MQIFRISKTYPYTLPTNPTIVDNWTKATVDPNPGFVKRVFPQDGGEKFEITENGYYFVNLNCGYFLVNYDGETKYQFSLRKDNAPAALLLLDNATEKVVIGRNPEFNLSRATAIHLQAGDVLSVECDRVFGSSLGYLGSSYSADLPDGFSLTLMKLDIKI